MSIAAGGIAGYVSLRVLSVAIIPNESAVLTRESQASAPKLESRHEAEALRDLEACDDFAFNSLVALVGRSQTSR
jgi:hypothetical protein